MAVKTKIKDLAIGSEFNAGPATLRILDHFTDGTTLVITAESIGDRPFNIFPFIYERPEGFNLNDWRTSTIRKDLNENFLAAIKAAGKIDADRIVPTDWDLSDHQGGVGYGTSRDKIGLLSQKQFEKYAEQDLLELDDWWWLITPYAGSSYYARFVYAVGSLSYNDAYYGNYGVRPAFRLESGIEIVLEKEKLNRSTAQNVQNGPGLTEKDMDDLFIDLTEKGVSVAICALPMLNQINVSMVDRKQNSITRNISRNAGGIVAEIADMAALIRSEGGIA